MSIHPQYAEGILLGTKQVEFRKRRIADDVTHVVVYATAPVSAVVGAFAVVGQHTLTPSSLWRRFEHVAGVCEQDFMTYYAGYATGTGITVGEVLTPSQPMGLKSRLGITRPPQSFQYLAADTAQATLNSMDPAYVLA